MLEMNPCRQPARPLALPPPSAFVRLVRRLVLAAQGRTDGLRAQVRQVADAGPLDRLEQRLDPDDERADAEGGGRPLYQVGAAHAQRGPSSPLTAADQRVLGDHGEVVPGNLDEDHGEGQELGVLRPRHPPTLPVVPL
jgi:hypothetical protein